MWSNSIGQTLQELKKKWEKIINIFLNFIVKTRDIILERKMETGVWQKCHVARDNTTPLMRKVPESEGDRMRSALQEVLVSGVGWEARELCNLQSFFTHESSNSCQMASYEAFRDSCRAPFSSLHRLELQQLKRASYWRQDGQTDQWGRMEHLERDPNIYIYI